MKNTAYYSWVIYFLLISSLLYGIETKEQMLSAIHTYIQDNLGFSAQDADLEIQALHNKPLIEIHDVFTRYKQLIAPKNNKDLSAKRRSERYSTVQKKYSHESKPKNFLSSLSIVKRIHSMLPEKLTVGSDKEIYQNIAQKMKDLDFSQIDIDHEIEKLKEQSSAEISADYPELHQQLSQRLYYFDTQKNQGSDKIKNIDFWLQQLHQWGTSAVMLASYAGLAVGYDTSMLDAIAGVCLFDPTLTYFNNITKRNMLLMIYSQYEGFDAVKDLYLNPSFQQMELLTKQELLERMNSCLTLLKIGNQKERSRYMQKYENMSKQELESLYEQLDYFATHPQLSKLTQEEKTVMTLSKESLLYTIKQKLVKLELSRDQITDLMNQLRVENMNLIRAACLDIYTAMQHIAVERGKVPQLYNTLERVLMATPTFIAKPALNSVLSQVQNQWKRAGKSRVYQHLKQEGFQQKINNQQEGQAERATDAASRLYEGYKVISQSARVL